MTTAQKISRLATLRNAVGIGLWRLVGLPRLFIAWIKHKRHICAHDCCWEKGRSCYIPNVDSGDDEIMYFCWDHSHPAGFCPSCGQFWGGVERFDFSRTGLCENCDAELRNDLGEHDDDDEW